VGPNLQLIGCHFHTPAGCYKIQHTCTVSKRTPVVWTNLCISRSLGGPETNSSDSGSAVWCNH